MRILGIETSCDETAAAVVENGTKVLSNVISSSVDMHKRTGGVVPEVAAREHIRQISPVVDQAMEDADVRWGDIGAIAVTHAPGLIASLLIGVNSAQAMSYIHQKPLIPVHHVAGHIYANFLERGAPPEFPVVILTVSGGHNELILMRGHYDFYLLGETLDDAAGEAFDKVARVLGLGFPGGPAIAKAAEKGDPKAFRFPRPMLDEKNRFNFSFSGLKTAVIQMIQKSGASPEGATTSSRLQLRVSDIAAGFQAAVTDVLSDKLLLAACEFGAREVHLAGGVSANQLLRTKVRERLDPEIPFLYPKKLAYCTDNAAMIAGAAWFLIQKDPGRMADWKKVEVYSQYPLGKCEL